MVGFGFRELLNAAPVKPLLCSSSVKCCQGVLAASEQKEGTVYPLGLYRPPLLEEVECLNEPWRHPKIMKRNTLWQLGIFSNCPEIPGLCFGWDEWMLPGLGLLSAALRGGQSLHRLMVTCFFSLYDCSGTEISLESLLIEQIKFV